MDEFTPDILILGYSRDKTKVCLFSLTGLSPSMVGLSRAVLLTRKFVTSFKNLNLDRWRPKFKFLVVLFLLPLALLAKNKV